MYSLKDIVRINDILSEYHGVKCVVVKLSKKARRLCKDEFLKLEWQNKSELFYKIA